MSSTSPETGASRAEPRQRFCTECGAEAGPGRFCASCGAAFANETVAASTPVNVPEPSSSGHTAFAGAPANSTYDKTTTGGFVPVAAVARQTPEYVDVANLGVVKLASIGQRVLARVLDVVLVVIAVVAFIFILVAAATAGSSATYSVSGLNPLAMLLFIAVIAYLYEILLVAFWGRTVGKMIVGARIIRAVDGMKPNFGNAFLRWLAPGLGALIPFLGQLGATLVLLSPTFDSSGRRQGWHDKMAGTLVIEAPRSGAQARLQN